MLSTGSRLGPYEIVAQIGAGGMGQVFKALDTRIDRSVAIKILPDEFAPNAQMKMRFEREARTISQLEHPHICRLYDVGVGEHMYLVMELLEGESLADRLSRGPLALSDVVRYGAQIAEALAQAHRQGVVHRDLKPGNVMLTRTGVKLVDFGLARVAENTGDAATEVRPITEEGTVVGTVQYMSPEQLEGRHPDARSDIFALGAVLYEMTTGRRAFDGKTRASVIASVLDRDPAPMSSVQPLTPSGLERLVRTCLAKNADDRWHSAHDVAETLRWVGDSGSVEAPAGARSRRRGLTPWLLVTIALLVTALTAALLLRPSPKPPQPVHASILPPPGTEFDLFRGAMVPSPNGRWLTFIAPNEAGHNVLWLQSVHEGVPRALQGTQDAQFPFWSPDSRNIGFFDTSHLNRVSVEGGPAQNICRIVGGRGGTWSAQGQIIFGVIRDGLYEVAAAGGAAKKITTPAGDEADHRWPWFLPDGERYLYQARDEEPTHSVIWLGTRGSSERKRITASSGAAFYSQGHLLYTVNRNLLSQSFDVDRAEVSGAPRPLAEQLHYDGGTAKAAVAVSDTGLLTYGRSATAGALVWYDRAGRELGRLGESAEFVTVNISPDDRRIAAAIFDASGQSDIWLYESGRSAVTRFVFGPQPEDSPVFSPDGSQVAYASTTKSPTMDVVIRGVRPSDPSRTVWSIPGAQLFPVGWSADGKHLVVVVHNPRAKVIFDIWLYTLADGRGRPIVQSPKSDLGASLSPDATWLTYQSNESGSWQVYAQPLSGGSRVRLSDNGGVSPRWSIDGREIYFLQRGNVIAVPVSASKEFGDPKELFQVSANTGSISTGLHHPYAVSSDGQRFLFSGPGRTPVQPITIVTNWTELVRE